MGYWSMNEGTGARAGDASGNRNEGILTSGPTWVDGKRGKALSFDANDDLVSVGTPTSLNITGALTIGAWIYPRTFGSVASTFRGRIVDKENDFITGYSFSLYDPGTGNGDNTFALFLNTSAENLACKASANSIVLNRWQYVAVTLDSSRRCIPYVNGIKATTTSGFIMNAFPLTGSNSFTIGNNSGNTREFDGSIDEVRVYNRALGAAEIQALYKSGAAKLKVPTNLGLVGYWSMNEGTSTIAGDASGNGNRGILTNGPTWVDGKRGKALSFDGADDYVDAGSGSSIDNIFDTDGGGGTVGAWIKPRSAGEGVGRGGVIAAKSTDSAWSFEMSTAADNKIRFLMNCTFVEADSVNSWISSNTVLSYNAWQYVAVVYNNSSINNVPTIYINGTSVSLTQQSFADADPCQSDAANNLIIGNEPSSAYTFDGLIDDVRMYDRALSVAEIKALYQADYAKINAPQNNQITNGLVGMWSFNGPDLTTTTAFDRSGQGNNGTLTNGPVPAIGKIGQALNFDGSDDIVNISASAVYNNMGAITATAWIKPNGYGESNIGMLFNKSNTTNPWDGWMFSMTSLVANSVRFVVDGGDTDLDLRSNAGTVPFGVWTHVAITWNGNSTCAGNAIIYINGVSNTSCSTNLVSRTSDSLYPPKIGNSSSGASTFDGLIDEVRIYNRALSADEIKRLYNMGR
ncbi:MAG: LamG domain-containing protein [bacterium]|nr:LamG domain-containing protein [bacterium]